MTKIGIPVDTRRAIYWGNQSNIREYSGTKKYTSEMIGESSEIVEYTAKG